jgi:hypothetical protein
MRAIAGATLAACVVAAIVPARAGAAPPSSRDARRQDEPAPTLRAQVYSAYEQGAIDAALADKHATIEPGPEGKTVEGIDIVTLDVIDARDLAPSIINVLHVTTKHYVIDREILLRPGQPYKAVAVEESVRNLRTLPQLSLVLAIPVRGKEPGGVRLLVITKDVWSLRLAWDLQAVPAGIEDFVLQPSETNFLGTHQIAALDFEMDPATLSYGAGYHVPRLEGTRNVLDVSAQAIFNRASGSPEGTTGQVLGYQPLFSAKTEWAWDSLMTWDQQIARRFVNAAESCYPVTTCTGGRDDVPFEYFTRTYFANESVTRSFGWDVKHDISLGGFVDLREYRTTGAQAAYDPATIAQFAALNVPRSVDRVGPFLQYHGYRTRFIRVLDFQTLGLQEDYRLGHEVYLRVYPMPKAFGSSSDELGVYAALNYTVALRDGLLRGTVESITEAGSSAIADASIAAGGELVTPRTPIGRFVYDFEALNRYRNSLNQETFLGGDTRLRGYPSNAFVGSDVLVSNLEFRSRPVELLNTVEVGLDLFYDVGDAAFGFNNLHPYQGVGAGFRALFPQLDREVFRVDFGFPVGAGRELPGVAPWTFFIAFQQAFTLPTLTAAALPSGAPSD